MLVGRSYAAVDRELLRKLPCLACVAMLGAGSVLLIVASIAMPSSFNWISIIRMAFVIKVVVIINDILVIITISITWIN